VNRKDPSGTRRLENEEIRRQRLLISAYTEAMAEVAVGNDPRRTEALERLSAGLKNDLQEAADDYLRATSEATVRHTQQVLNNLHTGIQLGNVPIPAEEVDMLRMNIRRQFGLEGDNILATITRVVTEGYQEGAGADEMRRAILDELPSFTDRAERIVRTETMRVCDTVSKARYDAAGCDGYYSFPTDDDRLCPSCITYATGGSGTTLKVYGLDEPMALPWHPNCRCCRIPHFEGMELTI
jgi:SPP1 gp7 family putative phage head morphogenesis protein